MGKPVEWLDAIEKGMADKATLVQKLRQSSAAARPDTVGRRRSGH